ncbi:MAG: GTPase Era [Chlorobiales bacterium]|jgi:GTPase|nr:GTPase Era [Chlorobiales bacterium]
MNDRENQAAADKKDTGFKAGFVTIIGEPNAGKSTLLNALLGQKLSIVTPKPQTTRKQILGIYSADDCQIVFVDTPGIMKPKYKLHTAMMESVDRVRDESDALIFIIDAASFKKQHKPISEDLAFSRIKDTKLPIILVLNKIDLLKKEEVLELIATLSTQFEFKEFVPVSAIKGYNLKELVKALKLYLPQSEALYPSDILSTAPERFFVSEIVREKIFQLYHKEIPYSTEVEVEEFKENFEQDSTRKDVIRCAIVVERASQKIILIGKKGEAIKRLGQAARRDIEAFLERPVYLELFVKVREDWREQDAKLREFGYK